MENKIFKIDNSFTPAQQVMAEIINGLYKNNKICMISNNLKVRLLNLWANDEQYFENNFNRGTVGISIEEIDIIKNLHSNPTGSKDGLIISRRIVATFVNRSPGVVGEIIDNKRGANEATRKTKPKLFGDTGKKLQKKKSPAPLNPSNSQSNLINFNISNSQNPIITSFQQSSVSAQNSFFVQSSNQAFTSQQPVQNNFFTQNLQNFNQLQNQDIQQNYNQIQTELPKDLMQENFDSNDQQEQYDPSFFGPNENFPFF